METIFKIAMVMVIAILGVSTLALYYVNQSCQTEKPNQLQLQDLESKKPEYSEDILLGIVSETEYSPTEEGQFIIRITDTKSNPLTGLCFGSVAYPDKTIYVDNQTMNPSAFAGDYYLNFTVPSSYGVYEELVVCYVNTTGGIKKSTKAGSFHVSDIRDKLINIDSELTTIENKIDDLQTNMTTNFNNLKNDISNKINELYNNIYQLLSQLPSQVVSNIQTAGPNWFKQIAQALTGVHPVE